MLCTLFIGSSWILSSVFNKYLLSVNRKMFYPYFNEISVSYTVVGAGSLSISKILYSQRWYYCFIRINFPIHSIYVCVFWISYLSCFASVFLHCLCVIYFFFSSCLFLCMMYFQFAPSTIEYVIISCVYVSSWAVSSYPYFFFQL